MPKNQIIVGYNRPGYLCDTEAEVFTNRRNAERYMTEIKRDLLSDYGLDYIAKGSARNDGQINIVNKNSNNIIWVIWLMHASQDQYLHDSQQ